MSIILRGIDVTDDVKGLRWELKNLWVYYNRQPNQDAILGGGRTVREYRQSIARAYWLVRKDPHAAIWIIHLWDV